MVMILDIFVEHETLALFSLAVRCTANRYSRLSVPLRVYMQSLWGKKYKLLACPLFRDNVLLLASKSRQIYLSTAKPTRSGKCLNPFTSPRFGAIILLRQSTQDNEKLSSSCGWQQCRLLSALGEGKRHDPADFCSKRPSGRPILSATIVTMSLTGRNFLISWYVLRRLRWYRHW